MLPVEQELDIFNALFAHLNQNDLYLNKYFLLRERAAEGKIPVAEQ